MLSDEKQIIVLRGLPGSGKSTFSMKLWEHFNAEVVSADHNMINENGEYEFDITKLGECHAQCKRDFKKHIANEVETIVVDNTNTKVWEFSWYMQYGKENGYNITSIIVENRHGNESIHSVPEDKIEDMRNRFDVAL